MEVCEFADPGPLRDKLVAAVLDGTKTTTSSLYLEYTDAIEMPAVGMRQAVVDSSGATVATIEILEVDIVRMGDIDLPFAIGEGEGFESVTQWREAHEQFWREFAPQIPLDDDTLVVAETFRRVS